MQTCQMTIASHDSAASPRVLMAQLSSVGIRRGRRALRLGLSAGCAAMLASGCATAPAVEIVERQPLPTLPVAENLVASGRVFADRNGNGRQDEGEVGIAGVGVSNGIDIVETNARGEYRIEVDDDTVISVIKPPNYQLPLDALNRPQFFYIHRPEGSPPRDTPGIPPTGPLPRSVDFPLLPAAPRNEFEILVLADTQVRNSAHLRYLNRDIVAELRNRRDFAFGITLGDIAYDSLNKLEVISRSVAQVGVPWFNVIGNHDINKDAWNQDDSNDSFERHFGPDHYAFNEGDVHFVVLNSIRYGGMKNGRARYRGGLSSAQLRFLENDLRRVPRDRLVVVAFHYPINTHQRQPFRDIDRRAMLRLLSDFPHTLSLSGHSHLQSRWFLGPEQGWQGTGLHHHYNVGAASGSWWRGPKDAAGIPYTPMRDGTPNGYATIRFAGNQYVLDYQPARKSAHYRMAVYRAGDALYVNYFLGSRQTEVSCRINGGPWTPLQQVLEPDPLYQHLWNQLYQQGRDKRGGAKLPGASPSTHLWRLALPQPGMAANVTIRVRDDEKELFETVIVPAPNRSLPVVQLNAEQ